MDAEASTSQTVTNESINVKGNNGEDDEIVAGDCGDDDEGDEHDEYVETYLYVDFETKLLEEQLMNPNLHIKVLGIDTDSPIVQLNNKIFKGTPFSTPTLLSDFIFPYSSMLFFLW